MDDLGGEFAVAACGYSPFSGIAAGARRSPPSSSIGVGFHRPISPPAIVTAARFTAA